MSEKKERKAEKNDAKGKDVELYSYNIDDMIINDDGSIYLVGEQYYEYVTTKTTTRQPTYQR